MKRVIIGLLLLVTLLPAVFGESRTDRGSCPGNYSVSPDTILDKVIARAPYYGAAVKEYRSDLYVKGRMYVRRRNQIIRYIPSMFRIKKGVKEYLVEAFSELHYTAPNIYDQKLKAVYGTVNKFGGVGSDVLDYFHVNVYSPSLLSSKLLSPIAPSAKKYYKYRVDSVLVKEGKVSYRISFTPHNKSYQLVKGYMVISEGAWSIREIQFTGRSEYLRFDNLIRMGEVGTEGEYLPLRYDFNATFRFLGNKIDGSYTANFDYKSIQLKSEEEWLSSPSKKKNYDLTEAYMFQADTSKHCVDSMYIDSVRPLPLTANERNIYDNFHRHEDSAPKKAKVARSQAREFWGELGDMLISNYTVDLAAIGSVKCSPIINPFLMSYSGRDGFSYKQEFKYNRIFPGDRLLRLVPKIGYNFTHKEFYWVMKGHYDYWPRKRSSFYLDMGSGNRIYSSDVLDAMKEMPDSIFDFNKIHLDYFRDFYVDLRHRIEITNGLLLDVGISTHRRTAVRKSDFTTVEPSTAEEGEEIGEKFRNTYVSFAPRLRLSWTPGQYYYMSGMRKVNLHSAYPTFSIDWERGIKGILNSTGAYERIELDMQHHVSLGLMCTLYYRAGMGAFTNQKQLYFVDFANFSRNNLPIGWNDDIGGVFQILDRRWYNSSRKYLRTNITYEAPFLLLPRLLKYTRSVLNERLYLGVLAMPHLHPYVEVGYGIGTHVFDLGLFAGNTNGKFTDFGFKLTFELFNR